MQSPRNPPKTIDDYIAARPAEVQAILQTIRTTIGDAAPGAVEAISYGMPTVFLGRVVLHFGAFKHHIGLFPPIRDPELEPCLREYRGEKGNLRFPLDRPIPYALIGEIAQARVREIGRKKVASAKAGRSG